MTYYRYVSSATLNSTHQLTYSYFNAEPCSISCQYQNIQKVLTSIANRTMHTDVLYVRGDSVAGSKQGCGRREQRMMRRSFHSVSARHSSDMPYSTTAMPPCTYHVPHQIHCQCHHQLNTCVVVSAIKGVLPPLTLPITPLLQYLCFDMQG